MRLIFTIFILLNFASAHASFESQEELGGWVTFYYTNPEPSRIPSAVEYMSQRGWLDEGESISSIFGFLAGGFRDNPDKVSIWLDRLVELTRFSGH